MTIIFDLSDNDPMSQRINLILKDPNKHVVHRELLHFVQTKIGLLDGVTIYNGEVSINEILDMVTEHDKGQDSVQEKETYS